MLRIAAIVTLAVAIISEYFHCTMLETVIHPRPRGWNKVIEAMFSLSAMASIVYLVAT